MIEHVLPKPSPSQNVWQSMHWRKRNEFIHNMTFAFLAARNAVLWPRERVLVTVQRFSHKQLDPDNMVGGCKGILDAIVHAKLAVDDTSQWMARRYEQHELPGRANSRTIIRIESAPEDAPALSFEEFGFAPRTQTSQRTMFGAR